jgi:hypothetical protein
VPIFVLEAEPAAEAPLATLFGCRSLEKVLDWHPDPGECPFSPDELIRLRGGLRRLVPPLLARIRVERSRSSDRRDLEEFVERMEPVDDLAVSCTLDGERLGKLSGRTYFVRPRTGLDNVQAFIVWSGPAWPPAPDVAQSLAMALADALGINLVETFLAFIQSDDVLRLLDIAGASGLYHEIIEELEESATADDGEEQGDGRDRTAAPETESESDHHEKPASPLPESGPAAPRVPLHVFASLRLDGEPLVITGEDSQEPGGTHSGKGGEGARSGQGTGRRASAGTDLSALDALGMNVVLAYESRRLHRLGEVPSIIAGTLTTALGSSVIVDVHTPAAIARAEEVSDVAKRVLAELEDAGISRVFPGFDILTIKEGKADRLIELKSSGVDARVQNMSWNEWKSASRSDLRPLFWLYLVGNLRADIPGTVPYLRAINDPFGSLIGETVEDHQVRRAVQLRVREFKTAEHLDLTVVDDE